MVPGLGEAGGGEGNMVLKLVYLIKFLKGVLILICYKIGSFFYNKLNIWVIMTFVMTSLPFQAS